MSVHSSFFRIFQCVKGQKRWHTFHEQKDSALKAHDVEAALPAVVHGRVRELHVGNVQIEGVLSGVNRHSLAEFRRHLLTLGLERKDVQREHDLGFVACDLLVPAQIFGVRGKVAGQGDSVAQAGKTHTAI